MYDFMKLSLCTDAKVMLENPLLEFDIKGNRSTGELIEYPIDTLKPYNNFKFKITENHCYSAGTFHKYWHNGTNWQDFTIKDFERAIVRYSAEFKVNINKTRIHKLEFGVNINPPFKATLHNIRNTFIAYSNHSFETLKSYSGKPLGIECNLSHYRIKIYSKTLQYNMSENILRFEIQVNTIQKLPFEHLYLNDLLKPKVFNYCKNELINTMSNIIIYDNSLKNLSKNEISFVQDIKNPIYWSNLNKSNRYKKKEKYLRLVNEKSNNYLHNNLIKLVAEKGDFLTDFSNLEKATFLPLV